MAIADQTLLIANAATAFVDSLSAEQRAKILFPFERTRAAGSAKFAGGMNGRMTFVGEQYGKAVWSNYYKKSFTRPIELPARR